jgi:hypothetical protein
MTFDIDGCSNIGNVAMGWDGSSGVQDHAIGRGSRRLSPCQEKSSDGYGTGPNLYSNESYSDERSPIFGKRTLRGRSQRLSDSRQTRLTTTASLAFMMTVRLKKSQRRDRLK